MLSEDDFLKLIATRPAGQGLSSPAAKKAPTTPRSAHKAAASKKAEPEPPSKPITVSSPPKKKSPESKKIDLKPQQSSSTAAPIKKAETISVKMEVAEGNDQVQLPWVDKYKPTSLKQVIGKSENFVVVESRKSTI